MCLNQIILGLEIIRGILRKSWPRPREVTLVLNILFYISDVSCSSPESIIVSEVIDVTIILFR